MVQHADDKTAHGHHDDIHSDAHMVKIWVILLVLLVISILGPELGNIWITLITAFGIAFIKAGLVVKHFMHLTIEKPVVRYMLVTCLVFMVLFFAGVSPDVLRHEGRNWSNLAAAEAIARAQQEAAQEKAAHGEEGQMPEPKDPMPVWETPSRPPQPKWEELTSDESKKDWLMTAGENIYLEGSANAPGSACAACHKPDGTGYAYLAESLVGAKQELGNCKQIAQVIRQGTTAQISPTEGGVARKAFMPPYKTLNDHEIAAVASYIRIAWGNELGICTPEAIK